VKLAKPQAITEPTKISKAWLEGRIGLQPIGELWASRNQRDWDTALKCYWENPSVKKNLEIEEYMEKLNPEAIKRFDPSEWYAFLEKYFRWKFTDPRFLPKRLNDLATNIPEKLLSIKESLFVFNPSDIEQGLKIVKSKEGLGIKGLGWPGASGLLAVLFPEWFATVDQFVVKALREIESLPERGKLFEMRPKDLKEKDARLLIDIMRRKATDLNALFRPGEWTPRKIDMILWATRD